MSSKNAILECAVTALRQGDALTIDAVARKAGLTRQGVLHYFANKETLFVAVIDYIVDIWEADLIARAQHDDSALGRLRSYVDYALTGEFDASDLALLADIRLRERLCARWIERLESWLGWDIPGSVSQRASFRAARLLADGAWMNSALGIPVVRDDERQELHSLALGMLDSEGWASCQYK